MSMRSISQKKYVCFFCSKTFSRSEHKARHERSHTGVKPFECKVCRHAFVRRDLLQRHIRTVHRDLLLMKRRNRLEQEQQQQDNRQEDAAVEVSQSERKQSGNKNNGAKNDLYLELLVNSMIRVNNESLSLPLLFKRKKGKKKVNNALDNEQCSALREFFGKFSSTAGINDEQIQSFYAKGMKILHLTSIWKQVLREVNYGNDGVLAIISLGAIESQFRDDVWHICWSNINDIIGLDIMVFAITFFNYKPVDIVHFFEKFQRVYLDAKIDEIYYWETFKNWVKLLRMTNESNSISCLILNDVVNFNIQKNETIRGILKRNPISIRESSVQVVDILSNVMYCNWILYHKMKSFQNFENKKQFHTVLLSLNDYYYMNANSIPQEHSHNKNNRITLKLDTTISESYEGLIEKWTSSPIENSNHWLLLETFWFEFMNQINTNNQMWFTDTSAPIDISLINESLSICALPVLTMLKLQPYHMIKEIYYPLITDVIIFLLKIFGIELSINNLKFHPNRIFKLLSVPSIQLLIIYQYTSIIKNSDVEFFAINHFINDFMFGSEKNDAIWKIRSNFLDPESLVFKGYYQLMQLLLQNVKEEIIENKLLKMNTLNQNIKLRLQELSFECINFNTNLVEDHKHSLKFDPSEFNHEFSSQQISRRMTDPWQQNNCWIVPPSSANSISIGLFQSSHDNQNNSNSKNNSIQSFGMTNSRSMDVTSFRNPSIILPPLNINSMRRPSLDQSLMSRNQFDITSHSPPLVQQQPCQQYSNLVATNNSNNSNVFSNMNGASNNGKINHFYSYGPEPVSPKTIPQNMQMNSSVYATPFASQGMLATSPTTSSAPPTNMSPSSVNTTYSVGETALSDNGSPRSVNSVRLPPPSELFGVSSK